MCLPDAISSAQAHLLSIYPVAHVIPWEELCKDNEVHTNHQTSLSVVQMQYGSEQIDRIMNQVVYVWENETNSIKNHFHHFEPSHTTARLARDKFISARYSDEEEKKHLFFTVCGTHQHGIQGIMFWESKRSTIHLHSLMTSPLNIASPITDSQLRVKGVGATCVRHLQQICEEKNYEKISLCSLAGSVKFYQRCGFEYIDRGGINLMNWDRATSPIAQ